MVDVAELVAEILPDRRDLKLGLVQEMATVATPISTSGINLSVDRRELEGVDEAAAHSEVADTEPPPAHSPLP